MFLMPCICKEKFISLFSKKIKDQVADKVFHVKMIVTVLQTRNEQTLRLKTQKMRKEEA